MATTKTLNQQVYNYNIPAKCYILFHNTFVYLGNAIIILKLKKKNKQMIFYLLILRLCCQLKTEFFNNWSIKFAWMKKTPASVVNCDNNSEMFLTVTNPRWRMILQLDIFKTNNNTTRFIWERSSSKIYKKSIRKIR
jgi:hypothetical protein